MYSAYDWEGIFDMLDDEIYVPRGSDDGFLNKVCVYVISALL